MEANTTGREAIRGGSYHLKVAQRAYPLSSCMFSPTELGNTQDKNLSFFQLRLQKTTIIVSLLFICSAQSNYGRWFFSKVYSFLTVFPPFLLFLSFQSKKVLMGIRQKVRWVHLLEFHLISPCLAPSETSRFLQLLGGMYQVNLKD